MLAFSVPPGYRRSRPPARPKLDPFVGIIEWILEEDKSRPAKQQHTAKRIFDRLRDEHGYGGGITIVRAYVHEQQRLREMFVPLRHDPGHTQVDFGEALAVIAGEERKIHFFAMDLPQSDACLVQAYPAETSEAFCEGHNAGFEFFGGVSRSILYDNTKLGLAACRKGLAVGFTTAAALVNELHEARDEKRLLHLQCQLSGYKLLIVDELGYVPLSPTGAELLFETFSQRYERGSIIVTSNLPFDEWTSVFASERLTGRTARPSHPPRSHPRNERRQLQTQTQQTPHQDDQP